MSAFVNVKIVKQNINTTAMKKILIIMFVAANIISKRAAAADQTITGNLTVNGTADIQGNVANIGSWAGDASHPGITFGYFETNGASAITLDASRNTNDWFWRHNTATGMINGMRLDNAHRLILFGGDGTRGNFSFR